MVRLCCSWSCTKDEKKDFAYAYVLNNIWNDFFIIYSTDKRIKALNFYKL